MIDGIVRNILTNIAMFRSRIPAYDSLSDPAMEHYWARKFGWTVAGYVTDNFCLVGASIEYFESYHQ